MKHIIILSGHSQRFLDQGYTIKPLIKIWDKTIIEYVTDTLNLTSFENVTFIIKKEDVDNYNLDNFLKCKFKNCAISIIDGHRLGPVYSVLKANCISDNDETLVTYCDLHIKWNIENFYNHIKNQKVDGSIVTHIGWHPHRIYNKYFAYLRVDGDKVIEIKEKQHFTNNPENEYASGGIYYFKTGSLLRKYCEELISRGEKVNNEFYITMLYNLMIEDNLNITHFDSKNYVCLGTPKDVELFDAFLKIHNHLGNDSDVINTWHYFQENIFNSITT